MLYKLSKANIEKLDNLMVRVAIINTIIAIIVGYIVNY